MIKYRSLLQNIGSLMGPFATLYHTSRIIHLYRSDTDIQFHTFRTRTTAHTRPSFPVSSSLSYSRARVLFFFLSLRLHHSCFLSFSFSLSFSCPLSFLLSLSHSRTPPLCFLSISLFRPLPLFFLFLCSVSPILARPLYAHALAPIERDIERKEKRERSRKEESKRERESENERGSVSVREWDCPHCGWNLPFSLSLFLSLSPSRALSLSLSLLRPTSLSFPLSQALSPSNSLWHLYFLSLALQLLCNDGSTE